jgi:SNF2 family DNA or RNA helicase
MISYSIVFTEWARHLDLIEIAFKHNDIKYARIDGSVTNENRAQAIKAFQNNPKIRVFICTIKTGGVGLNLTAANWVFMMEPQYNPQRDNQAIDRVHRIGQSRKVTIVRLIMEGSIEERVVEIADRKRALAKFSLTNQNTNTAESKKEHEMVVGLFMKPEKNEKK